MDINFQNNKRQSKLHLAVLNQDINSVEYLIKNGINIYLQDENGRMALHYIVYSEINFIKYILNIYPNINFPDYEGNSILHLMSKHYLTDDLLKYMIEKRVNVNLRNYYGQSPIMFGNYSLLVNYGANINNQDNNGDTLLHYAVYNDIDVEMLLDLGADVRIVNNNNLNPLQMNSERMMREYSCYCFKKMTIN